MSPCQSKNSNMTDTSGDDETIVVPGVHVRSWTTSSVRLGGLSIALPGRVVVSYAPNTTSTTTTTLVTVTSSTRALLSLVHVDVDMTADDVNQMTLRLATSDVDAAGTLLVHVALGNPVHVFSTVAETLVQTGALALPSSSATPMYITSYSNAAVWIESALPIAVPGLSITVGGAGDVHLTAPSIQVQRNLKLTIFAQGSVSIQAHTIMANTIKSEVPGRGSVYVQGHVEAPHLINDVLGMGSVNYFPSGRCDDSKIDIVGSGNAYVGSVVCATTSVNTVGNGDAYVQVVDTLARTGFGSGSIKYFNVTPLHLPGNAGGQSFPFLRQPTVARTDTNKHETVQLAPQPPWHEGSYVLVRLTTATLRWPPMVLMDKLFADGMTYDRDLDEGAMGGVVGLAMVFALGLVLVAYKRFRRGGYQLLQ
ncbi:hypothetical protein DYB30_007703 [Aphanomyces astaci]|uniref:Putative auto-transporter adhesin head GIN domain-containing protein n=1 Tax=Aphanomyces astaci TaxID=112090 RepID=A0A397E2C7_APHAT|nr:hypothetical protein DYB30_007703 [Aphanomyces astaci]